MPVNVSKGSFVCTAPQPDFSSFIRGYLLLLSHQFPRMTQANVNYITKQQLQVYTTRIKKAAVPAHSVLYSWGVMNPSRPVLTLTIHQRRCSQEWAIVICVAGKTEKQSDWWGNWRNGTAALKFHSAEGTLFFRQKRYFHNHLPVTSAGDRLNSDQTCQDNSVSKAFIRWAVKMLWVAVIRPCPAGRMQISFRRTGLHRRSCWQASCRATGEIVEVS